MERFTYYLSAFTSAARSVLQYICEDENKFYQANIHLVSLKKVFKKARDSNIHRQLITTHSSGSSSIDIEIEVKGDKITQGIDKEDYNSVNEFYFSTTSLDNKFNTESIVKISQEYISEIEKFIAKLKKEKN